MGSKAQKNDHNSQTIWSSPQLSREYSFSILIGIVLCSIALSSGCNSCSKGQNNHPSLAEGTQPAVKEHDHQPNTARGTGAAVKEIVAVVEKSLADLPPPRSVPPVCEDQMTRLRKVLKTAPGTTDAANANSALLRCTSKATNEIRCKGKSKPCGVAYYNPPIMPFDSGQPGPQRSEAKAVDVSVPDQIAAACSDFAGAGDAVLSTSAGADPATNVTFDSLVGHYSCGAWFKAAANNDPILLIALGFVPTIQLIRDLKTYTNGVVDVTPEAVLANSIKRVDVTLVTIPVGGTFVPVAVLPFVPVRDSPSQVVDEAHTAVQQRVNQVGKAVGEACKAASICR